MPPPPPEAQCRAQGQAPALRELQIGRVVRRERKTLRQPECRRPRIGVGICVDGNGHLRQFTQRLIAIKGAHALAPDRGLEGIDNFEPPEHRHDGASFGNPVQERFCRRRRLVVRRR